MNERMAYSSGCPAPLIPTPRSTPDFAPLTPKASAEAGPFLPRPQVSPVWFLLENSGLSGQPPPRTTLLASVHPGNADGFIFTPSCLSSWPFPSSSPLWNKLSSFSLTCLSCLQSPFPKQLLLDSDEDPLSLLPLARLIGASPPLPPGTFLLKGSQRDLFP